MGLVCAGVACGQGPAKFQVQFDWSDPPPTSGNYFVTAQALEAPSGGPIRTLATAGPVPLTPDLALAFDSVALGRDRVVVVEVRGAVSLRAPVAYYGKSERFALEAGRSIVVPVRLGLRAPPGVVASDTTGMRIRSEAEVVATATVQVDLWSTTAVSVELSTESTFPEDRTERALLASLEHGPEVDGHPSRTWAVDLGSEPCAEPAGCARRVFARFVDAEGYTSPVYADAVIVDRQAPDVVDHTIPALVAASELLPVELVARERLRGAPRLRVEGADLTFTLEQPSPDRPSTTYRFRAAQAAGALGPAGAYLVQARLTDVAGNQSGWRNLQEVVLDPDLPAVSSATITPQVVAPGDVVELAFTTSERLAVAPVVYVGERSVGSAQGGPTRFELAWVVEADARDGAERVTAQLVDAAGQSRIAALATLVIDATPPAVLGVSLEPIAIRPGETSTLSITFTEGLAGPPGATWDRPVDMEDLGVEGLTHTFRVTPHALGAFELNELTFEDRGGHAVSIRAPAPGLPVRLAVDGTPPSIQELLLSGTRLGPGHTLEVSYRVDEPGPPADVELAGRHLACTETPVGVERQGRCTLTLRGDEIGAAEQTRPVTVRAADWAGNEALTSRAVLLDFRPPALVSARIFYVPSTNNPLPRVERAGPGTLARVVVVADETLSTAVAPQLFVAGATLTPAIQGDATATFELIVGAQTPNGSHALAVTWQDELGNPTRVGLGTVRLEVDTVAPRLNVRQALVRYLRAPVGSSAAEDLGGHILGPGPLAELAPTDPRSPADALSPLAFTVDGGLPPALLQFWGDAQASLLLASVSPRADGAWPRAELGRPEVEQIWVTALDDAGNVSGPVRLDTMVDVVTAGVDPLGSVPFPALSIHEAGAPNTLPLDGGIARSLARDPALQGLDGATHVRQAVPRFWPLGGPQGHSPAAAYDSVRAVVVVLVSGETWEFDGQWRWVAGGGPDRFGAQMAYDPLREVMVLVGGCFPRYGYCAGPGSESFETWEYSAGVWSPRPAAPEQTLSGDRLFFDPAGGRMLLAAAGLYAYDGLGWTTVTPSGYSSTSHAAYFDGQSYRFLSSATVGTWGGVDAVTYAALGANQLPPFGGAAYDPLRAQVLHFGGYSGGGAASSGLFILDASGGRQEPIPANFPLPSPRWEAAAVFEAGLGRTLLIGGCQRTSTVFTDPFNCRELVSQNLSYGTSVEGRPAVEWPVDLALAGVARGEIQALTLRAVAGGQSAPYGSAGAGAQLDRWTGSGWATLAQHSAAPDTPEVLEVNAPTAAQAQALVSPEGVLQVRVTPVGINGAGPDPGELGTVSVDYIEALVEVAPPHVTDPTATAMLGGVLEPGEEDTWRVRLSAAAYLLAEVAVGPAAAECGTTDTTLALRDAQGSPLDFDDDSGPGVCSRLERRVAGLALPAGDYALVVAARGIGFVPDYSMAVRSVPADVCGNGVVEVGESCDDGNTTPGDGCSAVCN